MAIFSYTIISTIAEGQEYVDQIREYLILGFVSLVVLFSVVSFLFGIIISHRHVGPFVAFKRFLNDFKSGKETDLRLRELDEHKVLEELSKTITENFVPKK